MKTKPAKTQLTFSYLCKSVFICGSVFVFIATAPTARAQRGGKAEPLRIEFKRGTTTKTISDYVRGSEEAEYVLSARQGQRLVIKLTSVPAKSSCFLLYGPDNPQVDLSLDCVSSYSMKVPANGDYFLTVQRSSETKGKSRYRMTITIR